jgi:hypothetical protein
MLSRPEATEDQRANTRGQHISLRLIWVAWAIPALLSGFNTFMQSRLSREAVDWHWLLFNSLDWFIYAFLTPFVFRFSRRFPLLRDHLRVRIWLHVLAAVTPCVAWAGMGTILRWAIFPAPSGHHCQGTCKDSYRRRSVERSCANLFAATTGRKRDPTWNRGGCGCWPG